MELHACYFKDLGAFSTDQRRASATAGKLEPGRLVSAIGLLIPQCRPGRTTKTPRLQGNLSRRSRSYGHSMGVNTPARKSALVVDDVLTTGASMQTERMYGDRGVVIFARTRHIPDWVHAIFTADLADARWR